MSGVATEKPGSHLYPYRSLFFATVLLDRCQTSILFICSLKHSVDTEKLKFQKAALNILGYFESLIPFDLTIFQCLA